MSTSKHDFDRASQQDARAWSSFTGAKYTASQRQISSPLAQGFLGDRVSARDLIEVLNVHPLVGAVGGDTVLGPNGFHAEDAWQFNRRSDFIELALIIDMLRMFTPTTTAEAQVGSYQLKHTVEKLRAPHCSYVSNGQLIWAAAALGLPLVDAGSGGPNLLVGISEPEHDYVRQILDGGTPPRAHHHRPAGFEHFQDALVRCAAGESAAPRWMRPKAKVVVAPFHDWLTMQATRNDPVGDFAGDYVTGVSSNQHGIAASPGDLLTDLLDLSPSPAAYDAGVAAIFEWFDATPDAQPVRTKLLSSSSHEVAGFGGTEDEGDVERLVYACPCGAGQVVEEHDNIPGARDHSVRLWCDRCRGEWALDLGRGIRGWGLVPLTSVALA